MPRPFLVAQLGARMHYAVPRWLHSEGTLGRLYTDICAVRGWPKFLHVVPKGLRPAGLRRLLGRVPEGVPPERITAFTRFGLEFARRRLRARTPTEALATYLWGVREFCAATLDHGLDEAGAVFTYNTEGLELLQQARRQGLRTVVEQTIAPKPIEQGLLRTEQVSFPAWQLPPPDDAVSAEYVTREKAEWEAADLILCGSEFVRAGIAQCGGPTKRCAVVPYGVGGNFQVPHRGDHGGPLRVLTLGEVGLRKGSPYVLAAARLLKGRAQFRMVGSIGVRPAVLAELRQHLDVRGPVPRSEVLEHFAWADVFLLPSLCEGSATVTYEALACGLPVIATPNTGSLVRDELEGFIVPIRDPQAIADRLARLASDVRLRRTMAREACHRAQDGTLAAYGCRLGKAFRALSTTALAA